MNGSRLQKFVCDVQFSLSLLVFKRAFIFIVGLNNLNFPDIPLTINKWNLFIINVHQQLIFVPVKERMIRTTVR